MRTARLQRGFTLVELMVVLAIASLLIGLAPVAYNKASETIQYRTLLRTTLADLRQARQQAAGGGQPVSYLVKLQARQQGIEGRVMRAIPADFKVRATVGQELLRNDTAAIVFLPAGGSSGGSIEIIRPSGQGTRLRVDWFSGHVTQERLLP